VRIIARSALSALGSANLVALAQLEAFRLFVHRPLLLLPGPVGAAINRAYVRRKIRSALGQRASAPARLPGLMYAPAVPGPGFPTVGSLEATAAMSDELRTWLSGLWSYRWDPSAFGLAENDTTARSIAAARSMRR
jgi:hypothetical protein